MCPPMTSMTRIERIQPSLHKKDRVLVYLTGGRLLRITPEELLRIAYYA